MYSLKIFNNEEKQIDANIVFAFHCDETGKKYVAMDYQKHIFEPNSSYSNLDILEIKKEENKNLYITNISEEEWPAVKRSLQVKVFASVKDTQ